MSNADAARHAAKSRWEREGNPVIARSVETVVTRADELSDEQRAAIEAAISTEADDE
jgi:hypothetical protein